MRSAAVNAGGGGVLVWGGGKLFEVEVADVAVPVFAAAAEDVACPPCGDGSCDVDWTSPTATHVEQERDACSNLKKSHNDVLILKIEIRDR